jgi:hypothetical protein
MPSNDYICAKCGKHFKDIEAWKNWCNPKNCPNKLEYERELTDGEKRKRRDERIKSLPPLEPIPKYISVITYTLIALVIIGVIYGLFMLIKWLISIL